MAAGDRKPWEPLRLRTPDTDAATTPEPSFLLRTWTGTGTGAAWTTCNHFIFISMAPPCVNTGQRVVSVFYGFFFSPFSVERILLFICVVWISLVCDRTVWTIISSLFLRLFPPFFVSTLLKEQFPVLYRFFFFPFLVERMFLFICVMWISLVCDRTVWTIISSLFLRFPFVSTLYRRIVYF